MHITAFILAGGASRRMGQDKLGLPVRRRATETILHHVVETVQEVADEVLVLAPPSSQPIAHQSEGIRVIRDVDWYQGPLAALAKAWTQMLAGETLGDGSDAYGGLHGNSGPHGNSGVLVVAGDYPGLHTDVLKTCIRAYRDGGVEELNQNSTNWAFSGPARDAVDGSAKWAFSGPARDAVDGSANRAVDGSAKWSTVGAADGAAVQVDDILQPLLGCYSPQVGRVWNDAVNRGERRLMQAVKLLNLVAVDSQQQGWPAWWTKPVHTPEDYEAWLRCADTFLVDKGEMK